MDKHNTGYPYNDLLLFIHAKNQIINRAIPNFIWRGKTPTIAKTILRTKLEEWHCPTSRLIKKL